MSVYYRVFYDLEAPSPTGERTNPETAGICPVWSSEERLRNQLWVISLGSRQLWWCKHFSSWVKLKRKEKSAEFVFLMAISQFSFPYAACPGAPTRDMGFTSTEGEALEHGGAGEEWMRQVRTVSYLLWSANAYENWDWRLARRNFHKVRLAFTKARSSGVIIMPNRLLEGQDQARLKHRPPLSSHSGGVSHEEVSHSLWSALQREKEIPVIAQEGVGACGETGFPEKVLSQPRSK